MEVLLEAASGIPPDAVVSLRLGPTRRQAPLQSALSHPLRFTTTLDDACEPLRVDVMRPLASARVVLRAEELRYSVPLEGKQDMALRLKVKPAKVAEREKGGEPAGKLSATLKDVTAGAKDYLEHHKILQYMQALLHAVIQAKPLDPFSFMVAQLTSARSRPSRSQRSRRGSCPGSLASKDSSTQLDLQPEIELASDPGPLPPSSVPSMTPFEVFSDPGQTRKASGPPSTAACPAPTEDAVPACHPDPEETEASLPGQRQEPEEPAPEGTGVLGDEELECLRGSLRRQLEEAVDEGKLASAVERAVALMSGQEDDEVRTRRELVQLQEEQKELRLRSERLKQDLRDLRRVNLDLRRQLMALKPLEVDGLPGAVLGADSCG